MAHKTIIISDPTLRDGNHALMHQLTLAQVERYTQAAESAGVDTVEVGHGCGLGGSSLQFGLSLVSDVDLLVCARKHLKRTRLGVHIIPGIGRKSDIDIAIAAGVDVFRVGAHCTEADVTKSLISYIRQHHKTVYGVLMMTHMASADKLLEEATKMVDYGAEGVILMDSAGSLLPNQVQERVHALASLSVSIGFHGHQNLGLALANSLAAIEAGAVIVDGTARGFGAGAGNTPLEILVAVLEKAGYSVGMSSETAFVLAEVAQAHVINKMPQVSNASIASGLYGVFSGFAKHVDKAAIASGVSPIAIYRELGCRKVVAGQEDVIIDVVHQLSMDKLENSSSL